MISMVSLAQYVSIIMIVVGFDYKRPFVPQEVF